MSRFFFLAFFASSLFGEVISSPTVETLITRNESSFWLVLDLDNTLFEGREAFGHADWLNDLVEQELAIGKTKTEALEKHCPLFADIQDINHVQPVEERLIEWVTELQAKDVTVLALTERSSQLKEATERQLSDLHVNLSLTAPKVELSTALYSKGILYANGQDKGSIFLAFLKENGLKPPKVLFIEDTESEAIAFEKALSENEMDVTSLHYTALRERESVYNPLLAEFQRRKLHSILSNDEALLLLHHQPDIHQ